MATKNMATRKRLRFNLRTFLCVVLLLGGITAWFANEHRKHAAEQVLISRLIESNPSRCTILYQPEDHPLNEPMTLD